MLKIPALWFRLCVSPHDPVSSVAVTVLFALELSSPS